MNPGLFFPLGSELEEMGDHVPPNPIPLKKMETKKCLWYTQKKSKQKLKPLSQQKTRNGQPSKTENFNNSAPLNLPTAEINMVVSHAASNKGQKEPRVPPFPGCRKGSVPLQAS
jgi:hypothetical protein